MKYSAQSRYQQLSADREDFLDMARRCAALTLPYLLTESGHSEGGRLMQPYQSLGSKGVNALASQLMLSLFPINTSFFKLQINDGEIANIPELTPEVRSEIDLNLSKMERIVMQQISESSDRVQLTVAMKHLIVTGNTLVFAGKKALKVYPLDRYVVDRDGEGTVLEIITKEVVDRSLLPAEFQKQDKQPNAVGEDGPKLGVAYSSKANDAEVYTCVKLEDGQHRWHQECDGKVIPGSKSTSPLKHTPWLPLRFNVVGGTGSESYGRGRVEEFFGDLTSLNSLTRAMVEGSAAAAKVVFMVSPSATTKPQSLAKASTGSIIQGRAEDVTTVSVGKTADFATVQRMIADLTQRISDAFLILNVRHSDRTTATEVNQTRMELDRQLSGIYGALTVELLNPYLYRKLHLLQRNKSLPSLPKGLVMPTVVAGLGGVGRGEDRAALVEFMQTVGQAMGPEALAQFIDPTEFLKRLAAASGIDTLNLVKSPETMAQESQAAQQQAVTQSLVGQAGQLAKTPLGEKLIQQTNDGQEASPPPQAGADL